jgi:hypothetical protein
MCTYIEKQGGLNELEGRYLHTISYANSAVE